MSIIREFLEFLKEYKVVSLAIAFIMAASATTLIKSLVDNIIMPFVGIMIPGGDWKSAVFAFGPLKIGWGPFLSDCINFIIVAFIVFLIAKMILREERVTKK